MAPSLSILPLLVVWVLEQGPSFVRASFRVFRRGERGEKRRLDEEEGGRGDV